MILMKILPGIPGRFTGPEWLALAIWVVLGAALGLRAGTIRPDPAIAES